jgi:hypothetical protein
MRISNFFCSQTAYNGAVFYGNTLARLLLVINGGDREAADSGALVSLHSLVIVILLTKQRIIIAPTVSFRC